MSLTNHRKQNLSRHFLKRLARMLGLVPPLATISEQDINQLFPAEDHGKKRLAANAGNEKNRVPRRPLSNEQ